MEVLGYGGLWPKLAILLALCAVQGGVCDSSYLIGLGSYDITGPAADVNMMGYANAEQIASGVHFRLRARSFVVAQPQGNRVVFVNLDACMASQLVKLKVIERLKARYCVFLISFSFQNKLSCKFILAVNQLNLMKLATPCFMLETRIMKFLNSSEGNFEFNIEVYKCG